MARRVPLHWSALLLAALVIPTRTASAATGDALRSQPATRDELAQLAVLSGGYGALTGYWAHRLAGEGPSEVGLLTGAAATTLTVGGVIWYESHVGWSLGQPQAIVTDGLIGSGIAGLWIWHNRARDSGRTWSPVVESTLLWSGATVGVIAGAVRYGLRPSPPGQAAWTGTVALWSSALSGLTAGALTGPDRREHSASFAAALGMEGGILLGSWLGRALEPEGGWSLGWVRAVDAGALLGSATLAGSYAFMSGDRLDSPTTLALAATGVVLGGVAGAWLAPRIGLPRGGGWTIGPEFTSTSQGLRLTITPGLTW